MEHLTVDDIDTSKITWAFWQKCYIYIFNNQFVCFIEDDFFLLCRVFKMKNGEFGADKSRPLLMIQNKNKDNRIGICEIFNKYLNSKIKEERKEKLKKLNG